MKLGKDFKLFWFTYYGMWIFIAVTVVTTVYFNLPQ